VKGAHSALKSYLQVSTGDLKAVYDKITLTLVNQHSEFEGAIAYNKTRTPHTARGLFYAQLIGRISNYALGRLWDQQHLLSRLEPLPRCSNNFMRSMGLPCAHRMQERLQGNGTLMIDDIHPHWHFLLCIPLIIVPLILEPAIAEVRGCPSGSQPGQPRRASNRAARLRLAASSTQREPFSFERVDMPLRTHPRSGLRSDHRRQVI
jgi:hypothetical protein